MTVKRKDTGEVEELVWGTKTKAYRLVLLGAVLAATPIGQNILNSVGIKTPVMTEITEVKAEVAAVKADVARLKDDVAAVKKETNELKMSFTGFQVDFDKYRKEPK